MYSFANDLENTCIFQSWLENLSMHLRDSKNLYIFFIVVIAKNLRPHTVD